MTGAPLVTAESSLDLANRVVGAISLDARHPANAGLSVIRWPSARDATPMAIVELKHGPWSGSVTLLFRDQAPRVSVRIDLDPACLTAMNGTTIDPFAHVPPEVDHLVRWSLLLHVVPGIIRRVAPTAATHSLGVVPAAAKERAA